MMPNCAGVTNSISMQHSSGLPGGRDTDTSFLIFRHANASLLNLHRFDSRSQEIWRKWEADELRVA